MKALKKWIVLKFCDFGMWVLDLGPRDAEDEEMAKQLTEIREKFESPVQT